MSKYILTKIGKKKYPNGSVIENIPLKRIELTNKELKWILFDLHKCNNSESVNSIKMYNKIIGKLEEVLNEKE